MQWWDSEKTRQHSVLRWYNKHWASFTHAVLSIPTLGCHTGNPGARCNLSSCWTIKWNQQIVFLLLSQKQGKNQSKYIYSVWFTGSPLLLFSDSLGLVVWTAASHGFLLARSRGCSLLEHRKRRCVVSHVPHMSRSEDGSELFNNALMDRTTGNPLSNGGVPEHSDLSGLDPGRQSYDVAAWLMRQNK